MAKITERIKRQVILSHQKGIVARDIMKFIEISEATISVILDEYYRKKKRKRKKTSGIIFSTDKKIEYFKGVKEMEIGQIPKYSFSSVRKEYVKLK